MMSIKEMYEYIYYKIYKSMDFNMSWGADWRAGGILLGLEILLLCSFDFHFHALSNGKYYHVGSELILLAGGVLYVINYFCFYSRGQWKSIVAKYDAWPRKKNFKGTLIVWSIITMTLAYSFSIFIYA